VIVHSQVIGSLIASLSDLKAIHMRASRLAALQQVYYMAIPEELAKRSRVADERSGTLVVAAQTSAVAAKLRQLLPRIVAEFVKWEPEVTAIRVEVQVSAERPPEPRAARPRMTAQALQSFAQLRDALPESPLREALARLVERGSRSDRDDHAFEDHEGQHDQGQDH
jgi:hypothetical protein